MQIRCQSLCSDSMLSFCTTAFHQARTSGHQWNSFYYFHLAFNPRDLYYRGYKKTTTTTTTTIIIIIIIIIIIRFPRRQAMTGKELFCSREFWCWCNAITLFCYLTSCQPLTARTDDLYSLYPLCIRPILIVKPPQDHIYRGLKIIIIIQNL